jgi:hypothetical protein
MLEVSKDNDSENLSVSIRFIPSLPKGMLGQNYPRLIFSDQAVFKL